MLNCGTYNYNVAKFLTNLSSPYSINDYSCVKDSFKFAEFIRQRKICNTEDMVSFDVESLFMNVTSNETIGIIIKDLYSDNKLKTIMQITQKQHAETIKDMYTRSSFHV